MRWIYHLKQYRRDNPLAVRLLAFILLFSSFITLLSTATQLYLDYQTDLELINERIEQLEATSLEEIANQVWLIDDQQIRAQLERLEQLPDLQYLALQTQFGSQFNAGHPPGEETPVLTRHYPLRHLTAEGEQFDLGHLEVYFDLTRVYQNLKDRVLVIFAAQAVKTFLVSIFILYIFWKLVTRHLGTLSRYARTLRPDALDRPLALERPRRQDELSQVTSAINSMRESLRLDIERREAAEKALAELNERLEVRVAQRTQELQQTNQELSTTLEQLRSTQDQLVEAEKMAALGNLVAGVAHEINTPIGIGLTAASFLEDKATEQQQRATDPAAQAEFLAIARESSGLITQNLKRAAQLVNAFKQVSADQSSEQPRTFNVREYLEEILLSMAPRLKQCQPEVRINCPQGLSIHSYPGALYQVLSNLIQNSLVHGFEERPGGEISIDVEVNGEALCLRYQDNGRGISDAARSRIFEPFFTTRRHAGSTGLGLHIAYNLSTQLLGGTLRCLPAAPGQGARFELQMRSQSQEAAR